MQVTLILCVCVCVRVHACVCEKDREGKAGKRETNVNTIITFCNNLISTLKCFT